MKRSSQSGQTIAITLFLTTLILTLCVAVIGSILRTTQESAQSKSYATLYNAAEAGLGMGQRDVNRAAYYMVNLVWTTRSDGSGSLNTELGPAENGQPYKIYEYFSNIQNWMGLDKDNGWMVLPTSSYDVPDKYYDFDHSGSMNTGTDELGGNNDTLSGVKQKFITRTWKTGIDAASAPDKDLYRYYIYRNPANKTLVPPTYASWYDDKMPITYNGVKNYDSPIIKKVFVVSTKPLVRVAVYIRMDLSDYIVGSPICDCGPGGTKYHNVSNDTTSPRYVTRCPNNTVRFLIAAVSESTPEAPSQFAQTNVTVELGRAIRGGPLLNPGNPPPNPLLKLVLGYPLDPGVFAPVLDPLVAASGSSVDYPGATVSGMLFRVDPSIVLAPRRIYLYERPMTTQPFLDIGNNTVISTNTIFFVGFNGTKYQRYYFDGPRPPVNINVPEKNFYYAVTATNSDDPDHAGNPNNDFLFIDFGGFNPNATDTFPNEFSYKNLTPRGVDDINAPEWSVKRASGYSDKYGKFYIQRTSTTNTLVGFTPLPGFGYFASVHTLGTTSMFPTRMGLLSASISIDQVNYK